MFVADCKRDAMHEQACLESKSRPKERQTSDCPTFLPSHSPILFRPPSLPAPSTLLSIRPSLSSPACFLSFFCHSHLLEPTQPTKTPIRQPEPAGDQDPTFGKPWRGGAPPDFWVPRRSTLAPSAPKSWWISSRFRRQVGGGGFGWGGGGGQMVDLFLECFKASQKEHIYIYIYIHIYIYT